MSRKSNRKRKLKRNRLGGSQKARRVSPAKPVQPVQPEPVQPVQLPPVESVTLSEAIARLQVDVFDAISIPPARQALSRLSDTFNFSDYLWEDAAFTLDLSVPDVQALLSLTDVYPSPFFAWFSEGVEYYGGAVVFGDLGHFGMDAPRFRISYFDEEDDWEEA